MNQVKAQKKPFDLTTHIRDGKGNIIKSQPYRLTIISGVHEYERPPGSGYVYTAGGDLIRKPSDKQIQAQAAKEFSNDQLLKQIEELKAQLESNKSFLKLEEDVPVEVEAEIPEVPVSETDNSEEIALMKAAGANDAAKELASAKPAAAKWQRPNFNK